MRRCTLSDVIVTKPLGSPPPLTNATARHTATRPNRAPKISLTQGLCERTCRYVFGWLRAWRGERFDTLF